MRFEFDIEPVEQARPRAVRFGTGVRMYDPKKVAVFKQQLGMLARKQMLDRGLDPFDGPLEVCMEFYRPVQTSLSGKERARRLFKSTSDALNGIIWADDNCIVSLAAEKYYADEPHLVVEVNKRKRGAYDEPDQRT